MNWKVFCFVLVGWVAMAAAACDCGDDDDDDNNDNNDNDDQSPGDDDDDNDDNNDDDASGDVLARYSISDTGGFASYGLRSEGWFEEPLPEEIAMMFYSDHGADFAVGSAPLDSKDEYGFVAMLHFDSTAWQRETVPETVTQVGMPAVLDDGSMYATASIYLESSPQMGAHTKIIARQAKGSWEFEPTPEISDDFELIDSPFLGSDGKARVLGEDSENSTVFILRRETTGWEPDTLPVIGAGNYFQCHTDHLGDCLLTTPDGGIWAWVSDWENDRGVVLSLQDSEWTTEDLPDPGASWDVEDIKFCPDGTAYAVGGMWLEEEGQKGLAFAYSGGIWAIETLPAEAAEWNLDHVYCDANSVPWALGEKEVDDEDVGLLLSKRSGDWAFEETLLADTEYSIATLLFEDGGNPLLFGASGGTSDTMSGWIQTLSGDDWTAINLAFLDLPRWRFNSHEVGITQDGTVLAEGFDISGEVDFLLQRSGGTWSLADAFGLVIGWDLIVY